MAIPSTLARIIGLLVLAVALPFSLAGCSALKLGYNNAPEVAYWWLDGYLDFTESQTPRVREDLARLHEWHRGTELARYAALLARAQQLMPGNVTPAQACELADEVQARLLALSRQAEPAVVTLSVGLEAGQLQHLARRYARNNADYRAKWLDASPGEQQALRLKQLRDRGEMLYGTLDEAQLALLRAQIAQSRFEPRLFAIERERRQQDLLSTLRAIAGQPVSLAQATHAMRGYLARAWNSPDPVWRSQQAALLQEGCQTFAVLHNSTSPAQRDKAVSTLEAYRRDLLELAAQR